MNQVCENVSGKLSRSEVFCNFKEFCLHWREFYWSETWFEARKFIWDNLTSLIKKKPNYSNSYTTNLPQACKFIKKRLGHKCFPVNFVKFLRTSFLHTNSGGCFWMFRSNYKELFLGREDVRPFWRSETSLMMVPVTEVSLELFEKCQTVAL